MSYLNDRHNHWSTDNNNNNSNQFQDNKDIKKDKPTNPHLSLWLEPEGIATRFDQYFQASDTASMNSITTTNDSFNWMGTPDSHHHHQQQHQHQQQPYESTDNNNHNGYGDDDINYGSPHGNASKMSSHLLDSDLRDPEDRGNLNLGYNRDSGNMDYMQEDPYSSHHRLPSHHDPYYSGGNTSFEPPHSEQSFHSDYNRQPPTSSYSDLPNGRAPHSGGYHPADQHNHLHQQSRSLSPSQNDQQLHHQHPHAHDYYSGGGGYRGDDGLEAEEAGTGSGGGGGRSGVFRDHRHHPSGDDDEGLPSYHNVQNPSYNDYEDYNNENMAMGAEEGHVDNDYYNDQNPNSDATDLQLHLQYNDRNSPGNFYEENVPPPKPPLSGRQSYEYDNDDNNQGGKNNYDDENRSFDNHHQNQHHYDDDNHHSFPDHPHSYSSPQHSRYPEEALHELHGERDDSYAGSYQGEPPPHSSGNYMDPYPTSSMSDHQQGYPDGIYSQGGHPASNYSFHGDPQQQMAAENPVYNDNGMGHNNHPDDQYPGPEDYRDIHNQSSGGVDVPSSYHHDDYNNPPPQQNGSFIEPHSQPQTYDPYPEDDRYSGHHSLDHSRGNYSQHNMSSSHPHHHPNESFQNGGEEDPRNYQRQYEGLPPVHQDPFANDPFHNQPGGPALPDGSIDGRGGGPGPYDYRSPSPDVGGSLLDFYHYNFSTTYGGQPYNDQGSQQQPYDDRGPPYDDRGGYDDRGQGSPYNYRPEDMSDGYGGHPQNHGYPEDYPDTGSNYGSTQPPRVGGGDNQYYPTPEHDIMQQRMDQMSLNAPPPGMDGRMTPADDGGIPNYFDSRGPDLQQVIDLMSSPDDNVVSSAVAYLQHLTYMDDPVKAKTRALGGIPLLISLLSNDNVSIHKNACGALQNLSYGRANNDNKRAIKNENGIPELIRLLRKTTHEDVLESVTGVLWNLSSCEDLKHAIIEDGLSVLMNVAIAKYAGFMRGGDTVIWSPTCRNATGILRNVSSAGFEARKQLRECKGLVNTLINILRIAIRDEGVDPGADLDNKPIENTVCILRNLSYRIQEVVEPDFWKKRNLPTENQAANKKDKKGEVGCFGNKGKAKPTKKSSTKVTNVAPPVLPPLSIEYRALWGGEIHNCYSVLFRRCTNPITLEAAAGAIQNLTACDWQPAVDSRMMIRKEKGLPLMVDLLSSESDRVLCATATALRNLAIDEKNKELIGKYSIRQLAVRLPKDNRNNMPDDTICAIVATLYEVVKDNQDFAMALIEDGLPSLMHINRSDRRYLARTLKFTSTLLKTMWSYKSLHSEYASFKYYQADFTTSKATPRQEGSRPPEVATTPNTNTMGRGGGGGAMPPSYNTLSRPISSQGWDDNTLSSQRMHAMQQQQQQPSPYSSHHQAPPHHSQPLQNPPPSSFYGTTNPRMTPTPSDRFRADLNRSNASIHDQRDDGNYSRGGRQQPDEIPMNDFGAGYAPLDEPQPHRTKPPVGGVPLFPALSPNESSSPYAGESHSGNNEPLYAQVNKGSRRRLDHYGPDGGSSPRMANQGHGGHQDVGGDGGGGVDSWV